MITEIIDGKLVVSHDTGVVDTYTEADLLHRLADALEREQEADANVEYIRDLLNSITQQTAKRLGIMRRLAAVVRRSKYV